MIKTAQLREFVAELRKGSSAKPPSAQLIAFTASARRSGPRGLIEAALALTGDDPAAVAQVVTRSLKSLLADIDEHGTQSEFADDAGFVKKALKAWNKKAGPELASDVLRERGLESELVAAVEFLELPAPEAKAWAALRKASRVAVPLSKLVKKPLAPWFAELVAAYIGRELHEIANSKNQESWQSKLADVPALVTALYGLGVPPIFGQRAMHDAKVIAAGHQATHVAIQKLGAR